MRAEARFAAMGSTAHVVVIGQRPDALLARGRSRLADLEYKWSRFREDSEVSRLNASAGSPLVVSPETIVLVARAVDGWRLTAGLFDPTVHAAMLAHGYDRDFALVGSHGSQAKEIQTSPAPGCAGIAIDVTASSVTLPAGAAFDSGGIGKGLAADLVSAELVRDGADGVIVNVGGDLRVRGRSGREQGWIITVPDSRTSGRELLRMAMPDGAVATSSTLQRSWRHGSARVHHLMDPRTGRPVDGRIVSATVVSTTAWLAEVYAKSVVIGSVTDVTGLPTAVEVVAVTRTGARLVSDGLREALLS